MPRNATPGSEVSARATRMFVLALTAQLPNISDVLLDSALTDMGIRPMPGQSGQGILVQVCQQCHNSHLDKS